MHKMTAYIAATKKLLKLREERKGNKYTDFLYGQYNTILRSMDDEFPLSEEALVEAAKSCDWKEFVAVISRNDWYGSFRNQIADEYREAYQKLVAPFFAVFEKSAWRNPSGDPLRDEDTIETAYRRKHGIIWGNPLGEISIAQMAEDVYGAEWVEAYRGLMGSRGSTFDIDHYVQKRYWDLRGEGSPWHYYRRCVDVIQSWREVNMPDAIALQWARKELPILRAAVKRLNQSTLTGEFYA